MDSNTEHSKQKLQQAKGSKPESSMTTEQPLPESKDSEKKGPWSHLRNVTGKENGSETQQESPETLQRMSTAERSAYWKRVSEESGTQYVNDTKAGRGTVI